MKLLLAAVLVLVGLYLIAFGHQWAPHALEYLPDTEFGFWVELIVPFLPMAFIGTGAALCVCGNR
jgi:hypothetical protein